METVEIKKIKSPYFSEDIENILSELEKTQHDYWNLDRFCANFLNMLIKINRSKNVLEIGTSNGYSGIWILKALEETSGHFTTIEFWEKRQRVARSNFEKCSTVKAEAKIGQAVIVLEDLADEIMKNKREKYDFIFIDANKREYIKYFELVDKIITDNGVIVADNILSHYEKVSDYVNLLFSRKDYQSQILEMGAGMMISKKVF